MDPSDVFTCETTLSYRQHAKLIMLILQHLPNFVLGQEHDLLFFGRVPWPQMKIV